MQFKDLTMEPSQLFVSDFIKFLPIDKIYYPSEDPNWIWADIASFKSYIPSYWIFCLMAADSKNAQINVFQSETLLIDRLNGSSKGVDVVMEMGGEGEGAGVGVFILFT